MRRPLLSFWALAALLPLAAGCAGSPPPANVGPRLETMATGPTTPTPLPKAFPRAAHAVVVGGGFELGPEVRVDAGGTFQAAEPILAGAGDEVVAGWIDLREAGAGGWWRLAVATSSDGGASWDDLGVVRAPNATTGAVHEGDPIAAFDPRTGDLWFGAVAFGSNATAYVARWPAGAAGFAAPVVAATGPFFDRPWLAAGPAPGDPGATRLYLAYNAGSGSHLHASSDGGATWSAATTLRNGAPHLVRVGADGTVHVAIFDGGPGYWVTRSTDGGATFAPDVLAHTRTDVWGYQDSSRFPGRFRVPPVHGFAVAPDGTRYLTWPDTSAVVAGDADVDVYFSSSTDGVAWTAPVVVSGDAETPGDQFFPWLEVGDDGRLHLVYLDGRRTVQADGQVDGRFDVVYATSGDGGATWRETFVTDQPFSSADAGWPGFQQFLGDFLTLAVAADGRSVLVGYPSTRDGDLDVYARRVHHVELFRDGFERGDAAAWTAAVP